MREIPWLVVLAGSLAEEVDCSKPEEVAPGFVPCCAPEHREWIRERAWTSPIWYTFSP